jgi:hypothetical protein
MDPNVQKVTAIRIRIPELDDVARLIGNTITQTASQLIITTSPLTNRITIPETPAEYES